VDVTLKLAKILILMPSEIGGLVGSWWWCCGAPSPPQLPLATLASPPPALPLNFPCFWWYRSVQYNIWTSGDKPDFAWEARWKEPLWYTLAVTEI
jgi:hypothetical protein